MSREDHLEGHPSHHSYPGMVIFISAATEGTEEMTRESKSKQKKIH